MTLNIFIAASMFLVFGAAVGAIWSERRNKAAADAALPATLKQLGGELLNYRKQVDAGGEKLGSARRALDLAEHLWASANYYLSLKQLAIDHRQYRIAAQRLAIAHRQYRLAAERLAEAHRQIFISRFLSRHRDNLADSDSASAVHFVHFLPVRICS